VRRRSLVPEMHLFGSGFQYLLRTHPTDGSEEGVPGTRDAPFGSGSRYSLRTHNEGDVAQGSFPLIFSTATPCTEALSKVTLPSRLCFPPRIEEFPSGLEPPGSTCTPRGDRRVVTEESECQRGNIEIISALLRAEGPLTRWRLSSRSLLLREPAVDQTACSPPSSSSSSGLPLGMCPCQGLSLGPSEPRQRSRPDVLCGASVTPQRYSFACCPFHPRRP
jgi:hypothetical protein